MPGLQFTFPLTLLVLLMIWRRSPCALPAFFCFYTAAFFALSIFLHPSYDHAHYLEPALQGFSFLDLIKSSLPHRSPVPEFLYSFTRIFGGNKNLGVTAFNGLIFAAILCSARQWLGIRKHSRMLPYILAAACLSLNPSILALSVSANKDFLLILYIIALFRFSFDVHGQLSMPERLIGFTAAFVCIAVLRTYLLYLGVVSITIAMTCGLIRRREAALIIVTFMSFLFVSTLTVFKWNEIRVLAESAYAGRAEIPWLLKLPIPYPFEGTTYAIISILTGFLGHFILPLIDSSISSGKIIAGVWQNLMLWTLLPIAFLNTYGSRLRLLLVSFLILHFGIQTMGSPNFGALLRLRLSTEVLIVFLAFWNLETMRVVKNESIA
jgi:hypothetical protein